MDEQKFRRAFRNAQATMAIEGLDLPDSAYELFRKQILGEISKEEFDQIVMDIVKGT